MSTAPVTFQLSIRPWVAKGEDRIRVTMYTSGPGAAYGSTWSKELPMGTTAQDSTVARLRAAARALLEATDGVD